MSGAKAQDKPATLSCSCLSTYSPSSEGPPVPRSHHSFVSYKNGFIIFGGISLINNTYYNDIWDFDPDLIRWREGGTLWGTSALRPAPRAAASGVVLGADFILFGGHNEDGITFSDLFSCDTSLWRWQDITTKTKENSLGQMPSGRAGAGFFKLDGEECLFIFGGFSCSNKGDKKQLLKDLWRLKKLKNDWGFDIGYRFEKIMIINDDPFLGRWGMSMCGFKKFITKKRMKIVTMEIKKM